MDGFSGQRRAYLKAVLAAGAAPWVTPATVWGQSDRPPPSERIALGFIGVGSHGTGVNLKSFLAQGDAEVVAVCDVDQRHLDRAVQLVAGAYGRRPDATGLLVTRDWRDIVTAGQVDAVVVSTPDHWHVPCSLAAVRAGKDVICEKPLTLTVEEGRILSDETARYGTVFQTASENRSKSNFLRACELVRNGRIGRLVRIIADLPCGNGGGKGPTGAWEPQPVPTGFDYNMWLGPAPEAAYHPGRCHYHFRWILDYSGGYLTDWGAHILDVAQWGNNSEHTGPVEVEGHGVFPGDGLYNTATAFHVCYRYADGVELVCRGKSPAIRFEGTDGWVAVDGWGAPVTASSADILNAELGPGEVRLRTCPRREHRDFLNCVRTRTPTYAPAEIGHRSITLAHIGNISMRLGRRLRWDPGMESFRDDASANAMLSRPMRAPWTL